MLEQAEKKKKKVDTSLSNYKAKESLAREEVRSKGKRKIMMIANLVRMKITYQEVTVKRKIMMTAIIQMLNY